MAFQRSTSMHTLAFISLDFLALWLRSQNSQTDPPAFTVSRVNQSPQCYHLHLHHLPLLQQIMQKLWEHTLILMPDPFTQGSAFILSQPERKEIQVGLGKWRAGHLPETMYCLVFSTPISSQNLWNCFINVKFIKVGYLASVTVTKYQKYLALWGGRKSWHKHVVEENVHLMVVRNKSEKNKKRAWVSGPSSRALTQWTSFSPLGSPYKIYHRLVELV